jgi:4'-phosphopantetheinyl transferase
MLSAEELSRAARFHFEVHRNRFITGRALVRAVLGRYLGVEPTQVEFAYGPNGKPVLAGRFASAALHFNLAHSANLALLAVTAAGPIGVDLEHIRPLDDFEELVARFFSPRESAAFQALPPAQRPAAFYNLWTCKEALLKATGEGIASLLNRVELSVLPAAPVSLLALPAQFGVPNDWTIHELCPCREFAAALAVKATNISLQCWRRPDLPLTHPPTHLLTSSRSPAALRIPSA